MLRASLWSEADSISPDVVKRALMTVPALGGRNEAILDRDIETGVKLEDLMAQVARHYLQRALSTKSWEWTPPVHPAERLRSVQAWVGTEYNMPMLGPPLRIVAMADRNE